MSKVLFDYNPYNRITFLEKHLDTIIKLYDGDDNLCFDEILDKLVDNGIYERFNEIGEVNTKFGRSVEIYTYKPKKANLPLIECDYGISSCYIITDEENISHSYEFYEVDSMLGY